MDPSARLIPGRDLCADCELPLRTCLCSLVVRIHNDVPVLVLQHPDEVRRAKGTARLMARCLSRCRVVVGERFDVPSLWRMLHGDGARSVLVYPEVEAVPAIESDRPVGPPTQLVMLDGTWRKSLRMLSINPLLQALPRLALTPDRAGVYGALRKARLPTQLSTLEATCRALDAVEARTSRYAPLLEAFESFVHDRAMRATSG